MATLNVRIDDDVRESFDALAQARGVSTSNLLRDLVNESLGRQDESTRPGDPTPTSLSAVQRLTLAHQHDILAILASADSPDAGDAEYHRDMATILRRGYVLEYPEMFVSIVPEMTRRDCLLVHDIFRMFDVLDRSWERLTDEDKATLGEGAQHALTFRGFDFNNTHEHRLANYGKYLIDTHKYSSMAKYFDDEHERGNSHFPALATYQRMLSVWQPLWDAKVKSHHGYDFTVPELAQVLAAWPYPGR